MVLVLNTTLQIDGKVVEEGTPFSKLTKKEKDLAKELDLLEQAPDESDEAEEEEAEEEAPAEEEK